MKRNNNHKGFFAKVWAGIYKKENLATYRAQLVSAVFFIAILGIYGYYLQKRNNQLADARNKKPRYTIGVISDRINNLRGGPSFRYKYTVNCHLYENKSTWPGKLAYPSIGQRCYIKYEEKDAENSEILFYYEVSEINALTRVGQSYPDIELMISYLYK